MKTETENSGPQPPVLSNIMNVLLEATGDLDSAEALQKACLTFCSKARPLH